jgi:hypothetical protein
MGAGRRIARTGNSRGSIQSNHAPKGSEQLPGDGACARHLIRAATRLSCMKSLCHGAEHEPLPALPPLHGRSDLSPRTLVCADAVQLR